MMPASKHGDPQLGVDIHLCVVPPSPSPVPLPTPHTSIVFDPFDYLPIIGATVTVCGMKRATAGTNGIAIHIPPGFPFAPKLPDKDDELFMGSATVVADGDPFSFLSVPVLSCQVAGMMSPFRPRKKGGIKAMVLPTVFNLAIPTTVFVGGPPTISLMGMAFKGAFAALGKLAKSGVFKRIRQKLFKKMKPGFLKCTVLRAEPVNILTGEVVVEQEDFTLPGRIPIEWVRSYTSGNSRPGACGFGWETPVDTRLEVDPLDGTVMLQHPAAGPLLFEKLPAAPGDEAIELELMDGARLSDHGTEFRVRTKEDRIYHFPKALAAIGPLGRMEYPVGRIADLCGNWLEFERRDRHVVAIHESAGRRIELVNDQGRVREVALTVPGMPEFRHVFVRYEYNAAGDLTAAVDALGHPYTFDYSNHHLIRHTDRGGLSFAYEYDQSGPDGWRVVRSWGDGGLYDYRFAYEDTLNERRITDSLGHVSIVKLDSRGLPIAEIDPLGGLTSYEYDESARTTGVTDPDGRRSGYEYDERGNLLAVTRPDDTRITFAFNGDDKAIEITDPNGATWFQRWDERALLREQVSPLGHTSRYAYDAQGMLREYVDPRGVRTEMAYDALGRLVRLTDGSGFATTFEHDLLSRILTRTDPPQRQTRFGYDSKSRLTAVTLPSGEVLRCAYDANDNLTEYVDRDGAITRLEYVGLGEVSRRIQPDGQVVEYLYDTEGRLVGMRNQRGEIYHLRRDGLGQIFEEVDYWGQMRRFTYTAGGRLRQTLDPLGRAIDYETDGLGRIVCKTMAASPGGDQPWQERFVYDANGNIVGASNPHVEIERAFDAESQLVREVQRLRSGETFTVLSQYDEAGNRIERRTEAANAAGPIPGHLVQWTYDRLNQAVSLRIDDREPRRILRDGTTPLEAELAPRLTRRCLYDDDGRLIGQAVTRGEERLFLTRFDYDEADNLRQRLDTQYGTEHFVCDPVGRVLQHIDPAGRVHQFLHDPAGDRWQAARATADGTLPSARNRLASRDGITYQFDAAGNVVRRAGEEANVELDWDAEQRLVVSRRWLPGDTHAVATLYAYDPFGRRMFKETDGRRTWFGWDGDTLAFDCEQAPVTPRHDARALALDGTSRAALAREYVYEPETFEPVTLLLQRPQASKPDWSQQHLHYVNDPNGCPVRALDDSGTVCWAVSYSALGEVLGQHVNACANPIRLQGQYADPETGLYYNRHRYYDPHVGAYVGQDPVGMEAGFNPYELGPNVLGWIDPLGLTDCMVTVYRVQPRDRRSVMGGAFLRAREQGKSPTEALGIRKKLMDAVNSSNPNKRVKALQDAQASGKKSPFISTTLDEDVARKALADARAAGRDVELVIIRGPRDKGLDFESEFARLGGRTSPGRMKDAEMKEFGIPDLFVPESGKSASGFEIIGRE